MSGPSAADCLSANVMKQIERLGGRLPDGFRPRDRSVSTPAGEHDLPPAVQALLAVEWPPGQGLCTDDEFRWTVHLPSDCEVGRLVVEDEPRAWYAIGWDEGQWYWLVDLAEADRDDFPAYRVDHDGSDEAGDGRWLSSVLGGLRVVTDRIVFPSAIRAGEASAADGGVPADALVTDANALVNTDPLTLLPLLERVTTDRGRLAAAVYRTSTAQHRDADPETRRQILALDAARHGALELSRDLAQVPVPGTSAPDWTIGWTTGSTVDRRLLSRLNVGGPQAIAEVQGRTVVATVKGWTLHVHDLTSAESLVEAHLDGDQEFAALALAELDGRWIAVTGSSCPGCNDHDACMGQIRRWNLADGNPIADPVDAHLRSVDALAVTRIDGRPVVLSGGRDCMLRIWDLRTDEPVGTPSIGHHDESEYRGIDAVAVGELDGRPIAVTGGRDGAARVWDLSEGGTPGMILTANADYLLEDVGIDSVSLGELDGLPVAVTSGDDDVRLWDLRSGQQLGPVVADHCRGSGLAEIEGRLVVATVDFHGWVRVRDLRTREERGSRVNVFTGDRRTVSALTVVRALGRVVAVVPDYEATAVVDLRSDAPGAVPAGHTDTVDALTVDGLDGSPVVVTGSEDGTARIWNLDDGTPVCPPLSGHSVHAEAVATARVGGRSTVLTSDGDTLRVWDPATGELSREIEAIRAEDGHQVLSLATGYVNGRALAVTAGYDRRVLTWDLEDAARADHPPLIMQEKYLPSVATAEVDGRQLALVVDGKKVRVLDPATGEQLRTLYHTSRVGAVVTGSGQRVIALTTTYSNLNVWDVATGKRDGTLATGDSVKAMALADIDGRLIAATAGYDRIVRTWDLEEGRPYHAALTFPEEVNRVAVTGRGHLVVAYGSDVAVFRPRTGNRTEGLP
ncbi:WD40 repeat domain-containing protein [Streptomyces sp. NPDC051018]|uniref:WD40 repeat domain-containing protein n=1 Tax=Streptomyces sp. NPDC051018 TaxID=3365639 RepID=UPI00378CE9C8